MKLNKMLKTLMRAMHVQTCRLCLEFVLGVCVLMWQDEEAACSVFLGSGGTSRRSSLIAAEGKQEQRLRPNMPSVPCVNDSSRRFRFADGRIYGSQI